MELPFHNNLYFKGTFSDPVLILECIITSVPIPSPNVSIERHSTVIIFSHIQYSCLVYKYSIKCV